MKITSVDIRLFNEFKQNFSQCNTWRITDSYRFPMEFKDPYYNGKGKQIFLLNVLPFNGKRVGSVSQLKHGIIHMEFKDPITGQLGTVSCPVNTFFTKAKKINYERRISIV